MSREGESQNIDQLAEKDPHDRWIAERVVLQDALDAAEEKFIKSVGPAEYGPNIRARDAAQKALENWDKNPPEIIYTVADLERLLEFADRNLKHAQNQKEYEEAMRDVDMFQKKLQIKRAEEGK